jgi:hypothetical protein
MAAPPPVAGVLGGKVEFAEKAFPIVAEFKDAAVQSAIRNAKPLPCPSCRGAGKISKRAIVTPPGGVNGRPTAFTWEEECPACGGYKDVYDPRIGQRLLEVIGRLGHVARDEKFEELRKSAEGCLALTLEVRDKKLAILHCKPVIQSEDTGYGDTISTMTGVTTEPDHEQPFHVEAAPLVEPFWTRVGHTPAAGQAVLIIGTASEKTEAGGWVWMRMKPAKGPEAILLCGKTESPVVVPDGRVVLGGLMVGHWTPEGGAGAPARAPAHSAAPSPSASGSAPAARAPSAPPASAAAAKAAPASGAPDVPWKIGGSSVPPASSSPPSAPAVSGPPAPGSLPVVLVIIAAGGGK